MIIVPISVRFYLQLDRANARRGIPICVRIGLRRRKIDLYTYLFIPEEKYWDSLRGRVNALPDINANNMNRQIADIETRIYETKDILVRQGKEVTVETMRLALRESKDSGYGILQYMDEYIVKLKTLHAEYAIGTVKSYITTRNHIALYLKSINRRELPLSDFSKAHLAGLEDFLMTEYINKQYGRSLSRNSCNKYLKRLKTALKAAVRKSLISESPFDLDFKMKYTKVHRQVLTMEQIKKLMESDFVGNNLLRKVRDVFAFSIYTGLRFGDVMALKASDIKLDDKGRYWVKLCQIKTKEEITIPLLKKAEKLFLSYSEYQLTTGRAMPYFSNQKINLHLKRVSEILGFHRLTFHQARHTFATTILLDNQVSIQPTSFLLGHQSIRSSEVYTHVSKSLLSDIADIVDEKLSNSNVGLYAQKIEMLQ